MFLSLEETDAEDDEKRSEYILIVAIYFFSLN